MLSKVKYIAFFLMCWNSIWVDAKVEVFNAGIGGNNSHQLLARLEKDVLARNPDLCILMVGTNDMLNSRKRISYSEYALNVNTIVERIKAKGVEVLLMSSPPVDSTYLFNRHNRAIFLQAPNEIMDSASRIVREVAERNNALFLNLNAKFKKLGLPRHNEDLFFRNELNSGKKDGVHPTSLGYFYITEAIYQFLNQNGKLGSFKRIVCLGDSITAGSGLKGSGTISGENYPSFLYRKLN